MTHAKEFGTFPIRYKEQVAMTIRVRFRLAFSSFVKPALAGFFAAASLSLSTAVDSSPFSVLDASPPVSAFY